MGFKNSALTTGKTELVTPLTKPSDSPLWVVSLQIDWDNSNRLGGWLGGFKGENALKCLGENPAQQNSRTVSYS